MAHNSIKLKTCLKKLYDHIKMRQITVTVET